MGSLRNLDLGLGFVFVAIIYKQRNPTAYQNKSSPEAVSDSVTGDYIYICATKWHVMNYAIYREDSG